MSGIATADDTDAHPDAQPGARPWWTGLVPPVPGTWYQVRDARARVQPG